MLRSTLGWRGLPPLRGVDRPRALGEPSPRMPGPERDDLAGDGHSRLLGRTCPDIEPDRAADAREILLCCAFFFQTRRSVVVGPAAPHRPYIAGLGRESCGKDRHVE